MGVACQVYKNKEGGIESIKAPNGENSALYSKALASLGSQEKASRVWAMAYTPEFMEYYGRWDNPNVDEEYNLDINGEPLYDDVIAFMKKKTYILEPLASKDVMDVLNFMRSTGITDAESLSNKIYNNFFIDGNLVINEHNLRKSKLYNEAEISRISSDLSVQNDIAASMRLLLDYADSLTDGQKNNYFMTETGYDGPIISIDGKFNQFGKQEIYNPYELDMEMRDKVGGIKDISSFIKAFSNIKYPELVERFNNDAGFRNQMFSEYSTLDRIQEVEIRGDQVTPKNKTFDTLSVYSYPNVQKLGSIKKKISKLLNKSASVWEDADNTVKELKEIEAEATNFGIDIIGLSDLYGTRDQEDFENLLSDLDIHLSDMHKFNYAGVSNLADSINDMFGISEVSEVVTNLPSYLKGRSIVYANIKESPASVFEKYSLLQVSPDIYQRVNKIMDVGGLYNSIIETAREMPDFLPARAYPASFFVDGKLDRNKVRNIKDNSEVLESLKKYILSYTDSNNTEEMVLNRLIFAQPLRVATPAIDMQRELNRYMNRKNDFVNSVIPINLYNRYLKAKLNNTDDYNNVLKYIDFKSDYTISLKDTSPYTLKGIDLLASKDLRRMLYDYALSSNDPTLRDLFYLQDVNNIYAGEDFKHSLYMANPELLPEYNGEITYVNESSVEAAGTYDDFIRIGNNVFMKVSEGSNGSVYQYVSGTEAQVKQETTQRSKSSIIENSSIANSPNINMLFKLSKNDIDSLSRLEC